MRIAIVPARGGSKRIPKKNIVDFYGEPIIVRTLRNLQDSNKFDMIHVSTDDEEIRKVAAAHGADVSFLRPTELSTDSAPILPVVRWVIDQFMDNGKSFSTVMLAMPCAPLLGPSDYANACDAFEAVQGTYPLLSVCDYPSPPEWAFVETERGTVMADPQKLVIRSQDLKSAYYDCGLFSIFTPNMILSSNSLVAFEFLKFEVPRWKALDIDTPQDLDDAKRFFLASKQWP